MIATLKLSRSQRLILKACVKDPRGNAPAMIEGVTRSVAWVRHETLEKLQEMGLMDNVRDLSEQERADKDQATINKMRATLSIMERGEWGAAHEALRQLVDMTELRHAQVWRITLDGRNAVEQMKRRKGGRNVQK
jgi:hypothetical protein